MTPDTQAWMMVGGAALFAMASSFFAGYQFGQGRRQKTDDLLNQAHFTAWCALELAEKILKHEADRIHVFLSVPQLVSRIPRYNRKKESSSMHFTSALVMK